MIVTSTEIQNNFGKYLELLKQEDIIISKNGKKVARLIKFYENNMVQEESTIYSYEGMKVSYEEFMKIARESEKRYEYIDGQVYLLSSPTVSHQKIIMVLSSILFFYFQDKECIPLASPLDVTLYKDNNPNVVQPDLLVICDQESIGDKDTYEGIPTLVIEVLSETSRSKDMIKKLDLYMQGGVKEYWIVNPFSEEVNIYCFKERELEKMKTYKKDDKAAAQVFSGLGINLSELFV